MRVTLVRFLFAGTLAAAAFTAHVSSSWAACSLAGPVSTWIKGGDGNWGDRTSWSSGNVPNGPLQSACITDGLSTVNLNRNAAVDNFQLGGGNGLDIVSGHSFSVWGQQLINGGHIRIDAGSSTARLWIANDVSLSGGGTVDLGTSGAGVAHVQGTHATVSLTNVDNTIEGAGILGVFHFNNGQLGLVDANTSAATLFLRGPSSTNAGVLEATSNGILQISTRVANTGLIKADGGTVKIAGGEIDGGMIASVNGGLLKTAAGRNATLKDVTIAAGTTYRGGTDTVTHLDGVIGNHGFIGINSGASGSAILDIKNDVTLTGGGTVQLVTNAGHTAIRSFSAVTLTNLDNTIRGAGFVSGTLMNFVNDSAGTVYANAAGQILTVNPGGNITNYGTFEAAKGATLLVALGNFTNYHSHTLSGGTYDALGTIQVNQLGSAGGEITKNGANIVLDGAGSAIIDKAGLDALSNFSNNLASGIFTILDGRNFVTAATTFSNAGQVNIAQGSTFQAGGAYNQAAGGVTRVDGTLVAQSVTNAASGTVEGTGTVVGNLFNYGTVKPGDSPGKLTIDGNFGQGSGGSLQIEIAGKGAGQYGQLQVTGSANLAGTLALTLLNGFTLSAGNTFDIMHASGIAGDFSLLDLNGVGCAAGGNQSWTCSNLAGLYFLEQFVDGYYRLEVVAGADPVPEPAPLLLLSSGLLLIWGATSLARRR